MINWSAVDAISNCFVALGLGLTFMQIRESRINRTMDFEDGLDREYRAISKSLPPDALLKLPISEDELRNSFSNFLNYFDLSNDEILFRKTGRVSEKTWHEWQDGMRQNFLYPAFQAAWKKVRAISTERFRELRKLEQLGFNSDPHDWRDDVKSKLPVQLN